MDELELVRQIAPSVAAPDAARKHRARLALTAAAAVRPRRFRLPTLRPRRAIAFATAVALLGFVLARGPFPFLAQTDPAAVAALQQAATVAARGPAALDIGDGYVYTKTDALWAFSSQKFTYLRPLTREFWIAADGSGRIRETVEEPIFLSEAERQTFLDGGFQVYGVNEDLRPGELDAYPYGPLPANLDELRELVRGLAEASDQWPTERGMFTYIGDLLRDPLTPPDVRASLFKLAATLPGVQLLGEMQDEVGRTGVAVSMTHWWFDQDIIIFDAETSALLEERTVRHLPYGDTPAPIVWSRTTYLEASVVPELPAD
jgi:hypothetical protein